MELENSIGFEEAADILWEAMERGIHYPEELRGGLELEQGYQLQQEMLRRLEAGGDPQAGWKLAFTSETSRKAFGSKGAGLGFLLGSSAHSSGHQYSHDSLISPLIEVELCFTIGRPLRGPGVEKGDVQGSLAGVAPALELLERRGDLAADLPLGVADNIFQKSFVTGEGTRPLPTGFDPGAVVAQVRRNGRLVKSCLAAEVMDDQLQSIAWLANRLAGFGRGLEEGMRIMCGTFIPPEPVKKGDLWEADFAGIGKVTANF